MDADISGLASGAGKVLQTIQSELENLNINAKMFLQEEWVLACLNQTVDIKLSEKDRIIYCDVSYKDVPELLKVTLIDKKNYSRKVFTTYSNEQGGIQNINETSFFKNQKRVVLRNCGILIPTQLINI